MDSNTRTKAPGTKAAKKRATSARKAQPDSGALNQAKKAAAPASRPDQVRRAAGRVPTSLQNAWSSVPQSTRDEFERTVEAVPSAALNPALWGPEPTIAEQRTAALRNLQAQYRARSAVMDQSLTRSEAANLLEVSEQAILDRLEAGDLVGLRKGREWRLPMWQFHAGTERGFLPGLAALKDLFTDGVVALSEWVTAPNVDLDGVSPVQELAIDNTADVIAVAAAATSAAW